MELALYPNVLNDARLIPIPKFGNSSSASNYRTGSTQSIFTKSFEKRIHTGLNEYNVLYNDQFSFRKTSNTALEIVHLVSDLLESFHDDTFSVCFLLVLRK